MSRKVQVICENCNALWWVSRWSDYAKCPKCSYVTDIFNDGFEDQLREDE